MIWKKTNPIERKIPKPSAYWWAKYKNEDDWLDASPEIVYLYYDGKWSVFRPGYEIRFKLEDFVEWSSESIVF